METNSPDRPGSGACGGNLASIPAVGISVEVSKTTTPTVKMVGSAADVPLFWGDGRHGETAGEHCEIIEMIAEDLNHETNRQLLWKKMIFKNKLAGPAKRWFEGLDQKDQAKSFTELKVMFLSKFDKPVTKRSGTDALTRMTSWKQGTMNIVEYVKKSSKFNAELEDSIRKYFPTYFIGGLIDCEQKRNAEFFIQDRSNFTFEDAKNAIKRAYVRIGDADIFDEEDDELDMARQLYSFGSNEQMLRDAALMARLPSSSFLEQKDRVLTEVVPVEPISPPIRNTTPANPTGGAVRLLCYNYDATRANARCKGDHMLTDCPDQYDDATIKRNKEARARAGYNRDAVKAGFRGRTAPAAAAAPAEAASTSIDELMARIQSLTAEMDKMKKHNDRSSTDDDSSIPAAAAIVISASTPPSIVDFDWSAEDYRVQAAGAMPDVPANAAQRDSQDKSRPKPAVADGGIRKPSQGSTSNTMKVQDMLNKNDVAIQPEGQHHRQVAVKFSDGTRPRQENAAVETSTRDVDMSEGAAAESEPQKAAVENSHSTSGQEKSPAVAQNMFGTQGQQLLTEAQWNQLQGYAAPTPIDVATFKGSSVEKQKRIVNTTKDDGTQTSSKPRRAAPKDSVPITCMENRERFDISDFLRKQTVTMTFDQLLDRSPQIRAQLARWMSSSVPTRRGRKSANAAHAVASAQDASDTAPKSATSSSLWAAPVVTASAPDDDESQQVPAVYIRAWVGNIPVARTMVDDGSLIDLINPAVVGKLGCERFQLDNPVKIVLANGSTSTIDEYVWLKLNVAGIITLTRFHIAPGGKLYDILLSRRWIKRVKMVIDHGNDTAVIQGDQGDKVIVPFSTAYEGGAEAAIELSDEERMELDARFARETALADGAAERVLEECEHEDYLQDMEKDNDL